MSIHTHPHDHSDAVERPDAVAAVDRGVLHACGQLPRPPDGNTPTDLVEQVDLAIDNLETVPHNAAGGLIDAIGAVATLHPDMRNRS